MKTINTHKGVTTTFFVSPSAKQNFDANLDDLAATRFKETDQVFYAFQIRNGNADPVTCAVEVLNGKWFNTVSMDLKRRFTTIASYSRIPPDNLMYTTSNTVEYGFRQKTVTLQPNETAILNIGVHHWPDAQEKHIQLLAGHYTATATVVPFCSHLDRQTFEIDFEVFAD